MPSNSSASASPDKSIASTISNNAASAARNFRSPFSWLSRATTSGDKKVTSPSPLTSPTGYGYAHRTSDISDLRSIKSDSDDLSNGRLSSSSLKDRFKAVRMREEAGITSFGEQLQIIEDDEGSPVDDEKRPTPQHSAVTSPAIEQRKTSATINPSLPPGTASGFAEAPRADEPVDWDLWQEVVSEGPAAVQRSSSEQLEAAIAKGIPQPIRGVIWQVLAQSKNEELEDFYHELVARGTEKEKQAANGATDANGNPKERASIASSASSIHSHSERSNAGTSNPESPTATDGFSNPMTPKPKTPKEELAHIKSLEKTIRRDLGARTSYSKYLMAAGLQDGLYGLCKAYALYDEEVGYAQGMNFIAMPLLFNVSLSTSPTRYSNLQNSSPKQKHSPFLPD
jgi:hypothetical protein